MARRTDQSIHLARFRDNLLPRREPYWRNLSKGGHLGFRKSQTGSETYVVRWRDDNGKRHYNALGSVSFSEAKECADRWLEDCRSGVVRNVTVQSCLDAYVGNLRAENRDLAADEAKQRFEREVCGSALGPLELSKLRADHIERWRDSLNQGRSPATVNRSLASLKAGLNYGFKRRLVGSDKAWRVVGRLKVDTPARQQYLSVTERQLLLTHCPSDLRQFLTALIFTGARPGEIARCRVEDFDAETGVLVLRTGKGNTKKLKERKFTLRQDALVFFRKQTRLKTPRAFLFVTEENLQWIKWRWSKPTRVAVRNAGLLVGTTAYVIRHSVISDWIRGGVDVATVAKATGTSIQMINDFYFKSVPDMAADKLAAIKTI